MVAMFLLQMGWSARVPSKEKEEKCNDREDTLLFSYSLLEQCPRRCNRKHDSPCRQLAGKDIVFEKDYELQTPLHDACASDRASIDTINLLIDTGGKKLLVMQDRHGWTALHSACRWIDNTEVIKLLIRRGGRELAKIQDKDGIEAKEIDDYVRWNHIIEDTLIISDYMDLASKNKLHQDNVILAEKILSSNPTVKDLNLIINTDGVPSNHSEMFQKYRDQKVKHEIFLYSMEWVLKSTNVSKEQRQLYSDYREKLREESTVSEPKRRRLLSSC